MLSYEVITNKVLASKHRQCDRTVSKYVRNVSTHTQTYSSLEVATIKKRKSSHNDLQIIIVLISQYTEPAVQSYKGTSKIWKSIEIQFLVSSGRATAGKSHTWENTRRRNSDKTRVFILLRQWTSINKIQENKAILKSSYNLYKNLLTEAMEQGKAWLDLGTPTLPGANPSKQAQCFC